MGHIKSSETRAQKTPTEWLRVGAAIGAQTNDWAGRHDIVAYVGPGAAIHSSPLACFNHTTSEVELNVDLAFGKLTPDFIGDFTETQTHRDYPVAAGAVWHEAMHARFSKYSLTTLFMDRLQALETESGSPYAFRILKTVKLFEESRIEAIGLRLHPFARPYVRATAMKIAIDDLKEEFAEGKVQGVRAFAQLAGLILARVDAGSLEEEDVEGVREPIEAFLGEHYAPLREIWVKAQRHEAHTSANFLIDLAIEWEKIVGELQEEKKQEREEKKQKREEKKQKKAEQQKKDEESKDEESEGEESKDEESKDEESADAPKEEGTPSEGDESEGEESDGETSDGDTPGESKDGDQSGESKSEESSDSDDSEDSTDTDSTDGDATDTDTDADDDADGASDSDSDDATEDSDSGSNSDDDDDEDDDEDLDEDDAALKQLQEVLEELGLAAEDIIIAVVEEIADIEEKERAALNKDERNARADNTKDSKDEAKRVFSTASNAGEAKTRSRLVQTMAPSSELRAAAIKVSRQLEKAKYHERDAKEVSSILPPGKLHTRVAVQGAAYKAKGMMTQVAPFRKTVRKHTIEPTLNVGVMVDISGSMDEAMLPMANTAWIMSEAVRRVQGRCAMVYYGNSVFPTLKPGEHLTDVNVYTAADGTEEFDSAFKALNGSLDLLYGNGARLLVVVSDGNYRNDMRPYARKWMQECNKNGVAVLWLNNTEELSRNLDAIVNGLAVNVVCMGENPADAAVQIGKAAADALTVAGQR